MTCRCTGDSALPDHLKHPCHAGQPCTRAHLQWSSAEYFEDETYYEQVPLEEPKATTKWETRTKYERVRRTGTRVEHRTVLTPRWVPTYGPGTGGGYYVQDSRVDRVEIPYEYWEEVPVTSSERVAVTEPGQYRTEKRTRRVKKYRPIYKTVPCTCLECWCWKCWWPFRLFACLQIRKPATESRRSIFQFNADFDKKRSSVA